MERLLKLSFIFIGFTIGFLFYTRRREGYTNGEKVYSCPDILIQKGSKLILKNSSLAEIPGVNPIVFENLEEYVEFLQWQRSQGINCPVLYLQESYDTQGSRVFRIRPSPIEPEGGLAPNTIENILHRRSGNYSRLLDSHRDDPPFNINQYPGFDTMNQYVGLNVPLDEIRDAPNGTSADAMDTNWGGAHHSQKMVDTGVYDGNKRSLSDYSSVLV